MEIELNGAKLKVYEDGTIEKLYKKGWVVVKGTINTDKKSGYKRYKTCINYNYYITSRIIGFAYLGLDIENPTIKIDHIDNNSLNNNLSNLRVVTQQENRFNTHYRGTYKHRNKWVARVHINGKTICLGLYNTEEEAHRAYLEGKEKYHIIH